MWGKVNKRGLVNLFPVYDSVSIPPVPIGLSDDPIGFVFKLTENLSPLTHHFVEQKTFVLRIQLSYQLFDAGQIPELKQTNTRDNHQSHKH